MTTLRFLVSLITKDNDYQMEQAAAAKAAAAELGVEAQIIYANDDPITQSTQLLKAIQAEPSLRPSGILVEPVGATSFPQVAKTAAAAGIGWAILSRQAEYAAELRKAARPPVFSVSADQVEVGRIQGRQVAALLPRGGAVLLIQGPSVSSVSRDRHTGLQELLAPNVHVTTLRGRWTEESAHQSVCSWLRLIAAQRLRIDLIVAQNDAMGIGARKAIEETIPDPEREQRWRAQNGPDVGPHRAIGRHRDCPAQHRRSPDFDGQSAALRDGRSGAFLYDSHAIPGHRKARTTASSE